MNLLYTDSPLFISSLAYKLGAVSRDLEELKAARLIGGSPETLREMGYSSNLGLGEEETLLSLTSEVLAAQLSRIPEPAAVIFQHGSSEAATLPRDPDDTIGATRYRFFPAEVLRQTKLDHVPYFCSYASGCAGFLALLITAAGVLPRDSARQTICATSDARPPDHIFDMVRERILGSDHASTFVVDRIAGDYQLLGISFYSTTRLQVPLVEIVKRTVQMTQSLAQELQLDLAAEDVLLHYPNIFGDTWKMATRHLRLPQAETAVDGLAERAHCGSSDSVITLSKFHRGAKGRLHVVVNYGVGLHLGMCILREQTPAAA